MSATIHYRKTSTADPSLRVSAPSLFMECMTRAFGHFPCELTEASIPVLKGLSASQNWVNYNPYDEIIELIGEYGSIELYATY